jgi:ribonuclease HI
LVEFAHCLLARAADRRNLLLALHHCANHGQAAGPDGLRPDDLDRQASGELIAVLAPLIAAGTFQPGQVKTIQVSKGSGRGNRTISIQDFADRVVERAVLQIIRPITNAQYEDCSYGARYPGRRREEALAAAERLAIDGGRWAWIAQDIRDAFGQIPRGRLLQVLESLVPAPDLLHFIARLIERPERRGVRQGGPLSAEMLLLYLHGIDSWWARHMANAPLIRWLDDFLIVTTPDMAVEVHDRLVERLQPAGMMLKYSRDEAIRRPDKGQAVEWLGYRLQLASGKLAVSISDRAWSKLDEHLLRAWDEPCPPLTARDAIYGWVEQLGPAYTSEDFESTYRQIASRARRQGFDEHPDREEIRRRWRAQHNVWVHCRRQALLDLRDRPSGSRAQSFSQTVTTTQQNAESRPEVSLYTDGACLRRSRAGGWAYLIVEHASGQRREAFGSHPRTTNNRMELEAVIHGLASLDRPTRVHLVTDSRYVHNGITEHILDWTAGGRWRRGLKNMRLWQRLADQLARHEVDCCWVPGHSGHPENEHVDQLAQAAARAAAETIGNT